MKKSHSTIEPSRMRHALHFAGNILVGVSVTAVLAAAAPTSPPAPPPLAPPVYPLKKSANNRYLVDQNGAPFLIAGESPQAMTVNITTADADAFFANRQSHGFNCAWVNLVCDTYTAGRTDGSTYDGLLPFTGYLPDGPHDLAHYDLTTPNPAFFERCDVYIKAAAKYGAAVFLDPIETGGWLVTMKNNGPEKCRTYGKYVGNRYKDYRNIVWLHGNDYDKWTDPASDAASTAVAQGIREIDAVHIHTVELTGEDASLADPNWVPIVGLDAAYTYSPTYDRVLNEYLRPNFQPVFMVEANYEFEALSGPPVTNAAILRKQEYWSLTSGAAGQLYGNKYTWTFNDRWKSYLDTPGANEFAAVQSLFAPRAWFELVPDARHTLLTAGYGEYATKGQVNKSDYATAARTTDGSLAIIYTPVVRELTVDLSQLSGKAIARWYDPCTGIYRPAADSLLDNSSMKKFTPPGANADGDGGWALVLETKLKYETENLAVLGANTGAKHRILAEPNLSRGQGTLLEAHAAGDSVSYVIPNVPAGDYEIRVGVERSPDAGIFQVQTHRVNDATAGVEIGAPQDEFAAEAAAAELKLGAWSAATDGDQQFTFAVIGKNPASSDYRTTLDYVELIPIARR